MKWTEHEIMALKPANKYQIIWQCHNFNNSTADFPASSISLSSKSFVNIIFYGAENSKWKLLTSQIFIFYLIWSDARV